jgi:hypothetical protein
MKQIILNVLKDMTKNQVNLGSEAARMVIANSITNALESNGIYRQHIEIELEKQKRPVFPEAKNYCSKKEWVCSICGKNTYDVDWDYIGSNTNHLKCELENEMKNKLSEEIVDDKSKKYIYESPDGGKTIYRREFQKTEKEVVEDFQKKINKRKNMIENVDKNKWSGRYEDFVVKEKQVDERMKENLDWYKDWKKEEFNNDDPVDKDRKRYAG